MEVAPGIHRIESVLGPRPFSQYLLRDERSLLVDTGVKETPAEVILPFLDGLQPDFVLNSHADVDHYGGNAAIKAGRARSALFLAHELDVPWIESADAIMRERYGWYAEHGLAYEPDVFAWLRDAIGPDTPIDVHLRGGERIRLGPRLTVEVLHLPGHTPGHVGLWDARVPDGDRDRRRDGPRPARHGGQRDPSAAVLRRRRLPRLRARRCRRSRPARLLTAHYDVMEGEEVDALPRRHGRVRRGRRPARRSARSTRRAS